MPAQQHLSRYARGLLIIFTMAAKPLVGDGMVEKVRVQNGGRARVKPKNQLLWKNCAGSLMAEYQHCECVDY